MPSKEGELRRAAMPAPASASCLDQRGEATSAELAAAADAPRRSSREVAVAVFMMARGGMKTRLRGLFGARSCDQHRVARRMRVKSVSDGSGMP